MKKMAPEPEIKDWDEKRKQALARLADVRQDGKVTEVTDWAQVAPWNWYFMAELNPQTRKMTVSVQHVDCIDDDYACCSSLTGKLTIFRLPNILAPCTEAETVTLNAARNLCQLFPAY